MTPLLKTMMELAAKAAGYDVTYEPGCLTFFRRDVQGRPIWNPLGDDGDSRRLQITLRLSLVANDHAMVCMHLQSGRSWAGRYDEHPSAEAAARMAVLRAASELRPENRQILVDAFRSKGGAA